MTGVAIVGELLAADAVFTAAVPAGNWDFWDLPQGTGLPSLLLTRPSRVEKLFLASMRYQMVTERIQATARASSAEERGAILKAVRNACRGKVGTIAGFSGVAVTIAGDGPDFKDDDAAIYIGSVDLRVAFNEPA
jgi:hypothetical protein